MSREQATAILILWDSRHFDSAAISELLRVAESEVARLIQGSRDLIREMAAAQ